MNNQEGMEVEDENSKFLEKIKKDPSVPIGMVGLTGIVAYGLYNLKNRKKDMSIYLIHFRLAAQGTLLGCLTLGVAYTLMKNHYHKFFGDGSKTSSKY